MAAGRHAGEQAKIGLESQQFAEAKTGIEMVARAGGDFWFRRERSLDNESAIRPAGQRVGGRVNDQRIDLQPLVDVAAQVQQILRLPSAALQAERFADFVTFLFIQAENDRSEERRVGE